ncbi:MAG: hypothetical protein K6T86_02715 [Pirellulales bacterium]|nr:hypothetical protein [Pirellulales bacterium]
MRGSAAQRGIVTGLTFWIAESIARLRDLCQQPHGVFAVAAGLVAVHGCIPLLGLLLDPLDV